MRIKFIFPYVTEQFDLCKRIYYTKLKKYGQLGGVKTIMSPLALTTLAALTPTDIDINITDENIEPINFDEEVDLVGITFNTFSAHRAYEIANEFKKRKVTVILGGIHASMLPEESIQHADVVVIGEAEDIWRKVIVDYQKKELKKFYIAPQQPDLKNSPIPRWDLVKLNLYYSISIQTTRGCPYGCEFCSVGAFLGKEYRFKPIENVIKEIEVVREAGFNRDNFFFADDSFGINPQRSKKLLKELILLKLKGWATQGCISIAEDDELLQLMAKAGCKQLIIGFENLSQMVLELMGKGHNKVRYYQQGIEKIYSYGISIEAGFIITDFDNDDTIDKIKDFIESNNFFIINISPYIPFPGTPLWQRLEKERRILHTNWKEYDNLSVCFRPKLMSPEKLQKEIIRINRMIFSYSSIYRRLSGLWKRNRLIKGKRKRYLNKKKIMLSVILVLEALRRKDLQRMWFILKSLWHYRNPELFYIFLNLHFRDVIYDFPLEKKCKRLEELDSSLKLK